MRISKLIFIGLFVGLFVGTCNADGPAQISETQPNTGTWSTDVIGVTEMHLSADYWVEQIGNADQVLLDQAAIEAFNEKLFATDQHMVKLADFPEQLPGREVEERIRAISKPELVSICSWRIRLSPAVVRSVPRQLGRKLGRGLVAADTNGTQQTGGAVHRLFQQTRGAHR